MLRYHFVYSKISLSLYLCQNKWKCYDKLLFSIKILKINVNQKALGIAVKIPQPDVSGEEL